MRFFSHPLHAFLALSSSRIQSVTVGINFNKMINYLWLVMCARIPKTIHTYLNNQTTYIISVSVSFYYRFVTVAPIKLSQWATKPKHWTRWRVRARECKTNTNEEKNAEFKTVLSIPFAWMNNEMKRKKRISWCMFYRRLWWNESNIFFFQNRATVNKMLNDL